MGQTMWRAHNVAHCVTMSGDARPFQPLKIENAEVMSSSYPGVSAGLGGRSYVAVAGDVYGWTGGPKTHRQ